MKPLVNALTIDVEDYFQINAFANVIKREDWDSFESRVERNTYRILDILDSVSSQLSDVSNQQSKIQNRSFSNSNNKGQTTDRITCKPIRATFFVLGWVAERYPNLIKEIHAREHEVACHGYSHKVIFSQTKEEFREDVKRATGILEDLTGNDVIGYRAPTYSVTQETIWALEILYELGFKYDSSIFPIKHDVYGFPDAPRFPFLVKFDGKEFPEFIERYPLTASQPSLTTSVFPSHRHSIIEFPLTTTCIGGHNLPISGGGYFRLLPYPVTKSCLKKINEHEGMPFVFYFHPWEIDPHFPKIINAKWLSKFRTYVNLGKTENRFKKLLLNFSFTKMADLFPICVS